MGYRRRIYFTEKQKALKSAKGAPQNCLSTFEADGIFVGAERH